MKSYKIYICAALFIGLTTAKIAFPQHSSQLRQQVLEVINHNDDYTQLVQAMGSRLTDGGLGQELIAALKLHNDQSEEPLQSAMERDGEKQAVDVIGLEPFAMGYETILESVTGTKQTAMAAAGNALGELPEAVSAFLQLQEEYENKGYLLPDNVRTDMPELPFIYTEPVAGYDSSGFGYRVHPIQGGVKFHFGTDFAANSGDDVLAFADGYVYAAGTSPGYGNYMILTHDGGFTTVYAHLSAFVAKEGDMVSCGQRIARVGQTGNATGPHLHFELMQDDVYINPEYYL